MQVQNSQKETQEVIEAADTMEKDWQRRSKEMERELKETRESMQNLEEENKRLLETLVRHSKVKA